MLIEEKQKYARHHIPLPHLQKHHKNPPTINSIKKKVILGINEEEKIPGFHNMTKVNG